MFYQWGQVRGHDLPQDVKVDLVVTVDESIPKTDNFCPRNVGIAVPILFRNAARGLSDNL